MLIFHEAEINFTCVDDEGFWVTHWVNVTVRSINDEPEFKEIGGKQVTSGIIEFVGDNTQLSLYTILANIANIAIGQEMEGVR